MKGKDITSVNKIVTNDLDVNNQIDMKSKKIANLADGTVNNDAVNKAQLISMQASLVSQINTLNNKLNAINNKVTTINTNDGYYYFTDQLIHNNSSTVIFPSTINKYPFSNVKLSYNLLRISVDGHYDIIYTDFYKGSGEFIIHDETNGIDIFVTKLNSQTIWTPITFNTIFPISADDGYSHVDLKLYIKTNDGAMFDGAGYSTFYIKYLHT